MSPRPKQPSDRRPPASAAARTAFDTGLTLHRAGRLAEAEIAYRRALALDPAQFDALHMLGAVALQSGAPQAALELISQALGSNPVSAEAHNNLGNALRLLDRRADALTSYERALELRPRFADALHNRALALQALGRLDEALVAFASAAVPGADLATLEVGRGKVLMSLQRPAEALAAYERAAALAPDRASTHHDRALALHALGRPAEALAACGRALALDPGHADAQAAAGTLLRELGRIEDAVAAYDRALALAPDRALVHTSRGVVLQALGRAGEAMASHARALALDPGSAVAHNNRGALLHALDRAEEALAEFDQAIALDPAYALAHANRGGLLCAVGRTEAGEPSLARALELNPDQEFLHSVWIHARLRLCAWDGIEREIAAALDALASDGRAMNPFGVLALTDDPALQRRAAELWTARKFPVDPSLGPFAPRPAGGRIRLGYYSADYHDHATGYLIAELIELHDRERFEVIGLSYGPERADAMRARLRAGFDRFIDCRGLPDREVARLSRELGIDVAIDLKGITQSGRTGIFASRAAPVQLSYLGYPGTMPAPYIDYLIADPVLVPPQLRAGYHERIAWLPDCYQVNDRKRPQAGPPPARATLGLPERGFVFCSFNNSYKILPRTFDLWMRILQRVEGSVLWLLEHRPASSANLRRAAAARGVAPERLVFAQHAELPEHLARHGAAGVFLDTLPCNAHTTASDALWAGLPVLTRPGRAFASRVAASLLRAVGLPELVVESEAEYEELAVALAGDGPRLAELKRRLAAARSTAPLFDAPATARQLEAAFSAMHERHLAGLPPDDLTVAR